MKRVSQTTISYACCNLLLLWMAHTASSVNGFTHTPPPTTPYVHRRSVNYRSLERTYDNQMKLSSKATKRVSKDVDFDIDVGPRGSSRNAETSPVDPILGGQSYESSSSTFIDQMKEKLFLGIKPTPEITAIMTIYFVEGALGLARLAQTFLLKDELQLGPAEMSALSGLFVIPWTVKPLYGFLSDAFPLFGYRRRSYLILAGLIGCLSYTVLGNNFFGVFDSPQMITDAAAGTVAAVGISAKTKATVAALLVGSGTVAFSDVVADGIVVQRTRDAIDDPKLAGGLQSLCWGSAAIGGLISAYFSGSLLEVMGPRDVFSITAVMPLIVGAIALLIDEQKISLAPEKISNTSSVPENYVGSADDGNNSDVKSQAKALWTAIKEPAVWKPALFLFLWQSTPTGEGAMLYFMTNDLGMGPEFLGRVRLVTAIASLVGVWLYQRFLRSVSSIIHSKNFLKTIKYVISFIYLRLSHILFRSFQRWP
mmetsp:Transcript_23426/g.36089  ORF Transcript_23426/g.36089 Transcript_23426/m.36089 type:complete len:481 (-) Transcript_23426:3909-5351(-)